MERAAGRLESAERWNRKALEAFGELGHRDHAFATNNLAVLLLHVHRPPAGNRSRAAFAGRDLLAEAQELAEASLEVKTSIDDPSTEIWTTYGILAEIADARGDPAAAADRRRAERRAYVAFPGHWENLRAAWGEIVQVVARMTRAEEEARAELRSSLLKGFEANDSWRNLSKALVAVLDGERDAEALVEAHGLDATDYLVLTKVLETVRELPEEVEAGEVDDGATSDEGSPKGPTPDREEG